MSGKRKIRSEGEEEEKDMDDLPLWSPLIVKAGIHTISHGCLTELRVPVRVSRTCSATCFILHSKAPLEREQCPGSISGFGWGMVLPQDAPISVWLAEDSTLQLLQKGNMNYILNPSVKDTEDIRIHEHRGKNLATAFDVGAELGSVIYVWVSVDDSRHDEIPDYNAILRVYGFRNYQLHFILYYHLPDKSHLPSVPAHIQQQVMSAPSHGKVVQYNHVPTPNGSVSPRHRNVGQCLMQARDAIAVVVESVELMIRGPLVGADNPTIVSFSTHKSGPIWNQDVVSLTFDHRCIRDVTLEVTFSIGHGKTIRQVVPIDYERIQTFYSQGQRGIRRIDPNGRESTLRPLTWPDYSSYSLDPTMPILDTTVPFTTPSPVSVPSIVPATTGSTDQSPLPVDPVHPDTVDRDANTVVKPVIRRPSTCSIS